MQSQYQQLSKFREILLTTQAAFLKLIIVITLITCSFACYAFEYKLSLSDEEINNMVSSIPFSGQTSNAEKFALFKLHLQQVESNILISHECDFEPLCIIRKTENLSKKVDDPNFKAWLISRVNYFESNKEKIFEYEKQCKTLNIAPVRAKIAESYYGIYKSEGLVIFLDVAIEDAYRKSQIKTLSPLADKGNLLAKYLLLGNSKVDPRQLEQWSEDIKNSGQYELIKKCGKILLTDYRQD